MRRLFFDFDLERILSSADLRATQVMAPLKLQGVVDRNDLPPAPPDVRTLVLLHAYGGQLYIATSELPGVQEWIENVSRDLNRLWSSTRGDVYAAKAGGGLRIHFDKNDNFTVQLRGRKVWRYSSEPYAIQPLYNSDNGDRLDYRPNEPFLPDQVDTSALQEVCLEPGDMLYVPRGFLHGTEADEDSLSFNLSLNPQPWADVVLDGLRTFLVRDPAWRKGASRDPAAADERLRALRSALEQVEGWDFLGPPIRSGGEAGGENGTAAPKANAGTGGTLNLRRNPLCRWSWLPASDDAITIAIRCPDESATGLEVSEAFLAILNAIPDSSEVLTYDHLVRNFEHGQEDARAFVHLLVEAGLLSWTTHG